MFSFIIPTYKNYNNSIFKCIEVLIEICTKLTLEFEVIVVDNHNEDKYILSLNELSVNHPIKILKNPVLGAHHSRRLGLFNAQGNIVVFVDDDNYLTIDYIKFIVDSFNQTKDKNLFIGCASKEFHVLDWEKLGFDRHSFACGTLVNTFFKQNIPIYWGAGMCMSKKLADQIFNLDLLVDGRVDKKEYIMSGEDHEISLRSYFLGSKSIYYDGLGLIHDFNIERLNKDYYSKIQIGFVYAAWILKLYYLKNTKNIFLKNRFSCYIFLLIYGSLYFIKHPFRLESLLILKDVISFSKLSKRFEIVSQFV
jgi:glucosyl-dolichyl phosphate glucuronosyltransferase